MDSITSTASEGVDFMRSTVEDRSRGEICLVVIYNHKYEKNIPVIDRIYKNRFSHVYHVMPFAEDARANVIGVYESSFQFQGYVAQAARVFRNDRYSHYVIVADDMVLAPNLNERNFLDALQLGSDCAFISDKPVVLSRSKAKGWIHGMGALACINQRGNACEWMGELPSIEEARKRFEASGLNWRDMVDMNFWKYASYMLRARRSTPSMLNLMPFSGKILRFIKSGGEVAYPMASGYSDFFVVPASSFDKFCHYCGVFAAMRMFVEVAIPTAMIFSCSKVKTLADIGMKAINGVIDYDIRGKMEESAGFSYQKLIENFPEDHLYIHPIKLSKWKDLP